MFQRKKVSSNRTNADEHSSGSNQTPKSARSKRKATNNTNRAGSKDEFGNNITDGPVMDINERFLKACAGGDFQTVSIILASIKDFNIDVTDNLGRTALRLAVVNENLEIVEALLSKTDSQKLREALLLAIYIGHTQIAELILRHPQYKIFNDKRLNGATDSFWQTPSSDDAQFSPDITPIMLSSQYNRTEIVQMLLLNGDRIDKPHEFHCKCQECYNRFKFDSLRHAQSRLNAYRALASESYISLVSIDPILTAFEMGHELRFLSEKEKYFKNEYLALAEKLSEYTVKLLSNVRGRDELDTVLHKTGKENEENYAPLARLDLALKYQEMPFVAHPNCQQKLVEIWYTGLRKITKMNQLIVSLLMIGFIFFIPFGSIIYILVPNTKLGKFMCLPCIKFITFSMSYLGFMVLLIISSLRFIQLDLTDGLFSDLYPAFKHNYENYINNHNLTYKFPIADFYIRNTKPNSIDIAICVWLLGLIVQEIRNLVFYGINDYFNSWSNILTCNMIILYPVAYGLKFYTYIIVSLEKKKISDHYFWDMVDGLNGHDDEGNQKAVYETFYWLNTDRFYWYSLDPINLSEGLFAVAIIFSFSKLCFWLPSNQNLGPLQITLGRMISDIIKFVCIFTLVFAGFLFGLHNLFWYYEPEVRAIVETSPHYQHNSNTSVIVTKAEETFGTIGSSLITVFFALYALGASDDTVIEPFKNNFTPNFGYILFGMFHITNITILFSMLIAMLTKSFESILDHSDVEWKFARSRLYMEFIRMSSCVPIPFNLIPNPSLLYALAKRIICKEAVNEPAHHENISSHISEHMRRPSIVPNGNGKLANGWAGQPSVGSNELTYKKVMARVAKRFLLHNSRETEDIKESDFDELKMEFQVVKMDMLNDMRGAKENLIRYSNILYKGISLLGEYFSRVNSTKNADADYKLKLYRGYEDMFQTDIDDLYNPKYNKFASMNNMRTGQT